MISVCMATYNGGKYIKDQLESILIQLSPEDEVIISDDSSTDDTLSIINSFQDKRIKLFHHIPVKGSSFVKATRNFENALMQAKGDFIFLADQDDVWHKDKVLVCLDFLRKKACVQSEYNIIADIEYPFLSRIEKVRKTLLGNVIYLPFRGCCMAFRRELLQMILPIPERVIVHDAWIGCMAFAINEYCTINEKLIDYRIHGKNVSAHKSRNSYVYRLYYRLIILFAVISRVYFCKSNMLYKPKV